jgi:hypothetical protein
MAWSIEQLPRWYGQHCQTHECRYSDEILRLPKAILGNLADVPSSLESQAVEEAVLDRFLLLNKRFGLPGLDIKGPSCPPASLKKGELSWMKKRKGRRKVGRKKRRMKAKIRHRK